MPALLLFPSSCFAFLCVLAERTAVLTDRSGDGNGNERPRRARATRARAAAAGSGQCPANATERAARGQTRCLASLASFTRKRPANLGPTMCSKCKGDGGGDWGEIVARTTPKLASQPNNPRRSNPAAPWPASRLGKGLAPRSQPRRSRRVIVEGGGAGGAEARAGEAVAIHRCKIHLSHTHTN